MTSEFNVSSADLITGCSLRTHSQEALVWSPSGPMQSSRQQEEHLELPVLGAIVKMSLSPHSCSGVFFARDFLQSLHVFSIFRMS